VTPTDDERFMVGGAEGRVRYPVVMGDRPVRRLLRDLLEIDRPRSATIYFLFRGSEPLEIEAYAPTAQKVRVVPRTDGRAYQRLLGERWEHYAARWQRLQRDPQFPPIVENFLTANLSRRLQLQLPAAPSGLPALLQPKKSVWDDLFVSERRQMALDQMLLTDDAATAEGQDPADPLPAPMPWYELRTADNLEPSLIEAMAEHVPVEAFYVRFGTFSNYLWFRDLNRKWHGDLANMILRRSVDRAASQRIEQQLSLRENALAKILGPQVIADVAIIGLDPQINYGAAIGVLFHARVSPLLARDLTEQRREALTKFPDAAESTVSIGDRQVSLIATPHGEVRSYYIADGDFHLVTTSRRLVQRFLEAGAGERALAASAGFRQARQRLAHDRGDAIFAYLSPEFFREQTSPALWIESQRRALSDRRSKLIALVRLQALAEGVAAEGLAELADVDLLPRSLAATASEQLQFDAEGAVDLLRGRVGYFVPAPDVEVEHASAAEAAAYRRFADRFRQEGGQMPPPAA
ncbi:MAG TPA: hypothetical protein PKC18_12180, partial [Lacipirellulaceae bacterium]|nr:hypothetical protein [Lacipirellulaceae bacterium]